VSGRSYSSLAIILRPPVRPPIFAFLFLLSRARSTRHGCSTGRSVTRKILAENTEINMDKSAHTHSEISSDISLVDDSSDLDSDVSDLGERLAQDAELREQEKTLKQRRRTSISSVDHLNRVPASRRSSLGSLVHGEGFKAVPKPSPVSLLGYDVARSALRQLAKLLDANDARACSELWQQVSRFLAVQRYFERQFCLLVDEKYYAMPYLVKHLDRHNVLLEYQDDMTEVLVPVVLDQNGAPTSPSEDDINVEAARSYNFPVLHEELLGHMQELQDEIAPPLKKMTKRGEPVDAYLKKIVFERNDTVGGAEMKAAPQVGDDDDDESDGVGGNGRNAVLFRVTDDDFQFYVQFANKALLDDIRRHQSSDSDRHHQTPSVLLLAFNQTLWWCSDRGSGGEKWQQCSGWIASIEQTGTEYLSLLEAIELYEEQQAELENIQNSSDPDIMAESFKVDGADVNKPPVAVVEIRTGLAKMFPRRRSSHG